MIIGLFVTKLARTLKNVLLMQRETAELLNFSFSFLLSVILSEMGTALYANFHM